MRPEDLAANREMVRDLNELIRERIGGGPLGVVFRAEDAVSSGRTVAVKVVWPELTPDDGARGRFVAAATLVRNVSTKYVGAVTV